jgi:1-acyl-sn-glycerol-3-phosphate acyltransferase
LLGQGYSVVMFPEGRRTKQRVKAKPGISRILEHHDASLLLCHINWHRTWRGPVALLTIKKAHHDIDRSNPEAIMDGIYSLKRELKLNTKKTGAV